MLNVPLSTLIKLVKTDLIPPSIDIDMTQMPGYLTGTPKILSLVFCDFQVKLHKSGDHYVKLWTHMLNSHKPVLSKWGYSPEYLVGLVELFNAKKG